MRQADEDLGATMTRRWTQRLNLPAATKWNALCSVEGMGKPIRSPQVIVACANPETIDGLQTYFAAVGIPSHAVRSLEAISDRQEQASAIVVFHDGFDAENVVVWALATRKRCPGLLLVLVTRE